MRCDGAELTNIAETAIEECRALAFCLERCPRSPVPPGGDDCLRGVHAPPMSLDSEITVSTPASVRASGVPCR